MRVWLDSGSGDTAIVREMTALSRDPRPKVSRTGLAGPPGWAHLLGVDGRDAPSPALGSEHTEVRCLEGFATGS